VAARLKKIAINTAPTPLPSWIPALLERGSLPPAKAARSIIGTNNVDHGQASIATTPSTSC